MRRLAWISALITFVAPLSAYAQTPPNFDYKLAFAEHKGQLRWHAEGFKVIETSAKPNGSEIGIRAQDASGHITLLGFLFLVPEQTPLTSAKCRDGAMELEKKGNPTLKIIDTSELAKPNGLPIALTTYTSQGKTRVTSYMVRGFIASDDTCGDLEFYADRPISLQDASLKALFSTYALDDRYKPKFGDAFVYAQTLFFARLFKAAAPLFEIALAKLADDAAPFPSIKTARRITTDQAGMAYGIAGDNGKARVIFEKAIAEDPDYPLYYYNLACADAGEKKLHDAQLHLQAAFARRANMISGESLPDPTMDDSFLPYKQNKEFWNVVEKLQASR